MFGSLVKLVEDVVTITAEPIEAAIDVTRSVTKPLADAAKETAAVVKEITKDIPND